jgi:hypothetical protein
MSQYLSGQPIVKFIANVSKVKAKEAVYKNTPVFNTLPSRPLVPNMVYAGIGSRETPQEIQDEMTEVAKILQSEGFVLRSGKARGADIAFEKGAGPEKEIFPGSLKAGEKELAIAREIHPNPVALDNSKGNPEYTWNLMARNTNQIFGKDLNTPVDFVLAWTPDGLTDYRNRTIKSGGTGQAIEMASRKGIPVINLANSGWREQLSDIVSAIKKGKSFEATPVEEKQYEVEELARKVAEIKEMGGVRAESQMEFVIAKNLPKILPESAKKETGTKTGNTGDISTSMLSKNGVTVDQAAHDIWQDHFSESNIDTETIKDVIIDVLLSGSVKNYLSAFDGSEALKELKAELKVKQSELNQVKKEKVVKKKAVKKADIVQPDLFSQPEEVVKPIPVAVKVELNTKEDFNIDEDFDDEGDQGIAGGLDLSMLKIIKKDPEIPLTDDCE